MMQVEINTLQLASPRQENNVSLKDAKEWIGRRLILLKPWLGFRPGTLCRVMCVVDFGDGLLLWIITDDEQCREIDQLDISSIPALFKTFHAANTNQHIQPEKLTKKVSNN